MKRILRFILFLIFLFTALFLLFRYFDLVLNLLPGQTERAKYERTLKRTFGADVADSYFQNAEKLKEDFTNPAIPFTQIGFFASDRQQGFGHRINLKEGEKLVFEFISDTAKVFCEVFRIAEMDPEKWLIYQSSTFYPNRSDGKADKMECTQSGEYLIRFQPEYGVVSGYSLSVFTEPILSFPVQGKNNRAIQSVWGDPRDGGRRKHEGIDIFAAKGTPVVAAEPGRVTSTKIGGLGGKVVWVRAADGSRSTYYAHLDEQKVRNGQVVKAGDILGTVGNTGNAKTTPPHLHFGIYKKTGAVDPYPFVAYQNKYSESQPRATSPNKFELRTHLGQTNFRAAPVVKSELILTLGPQTTLNVMGAIGQWYHTRTENGISGFVSASVVNF